MIKHYIIDGNNVIGKDKDLKKANQDSRARLVFLLEKYFLNKKVSVRLYFDGYEKDRIRAGKLKIMYSNNLTADDLIRNEISKTKNCRTVCLVTSDFSVAEFGRKNSCTVISSEEFLQSMKTKKNNNEEELAAERISKNEMLKLFGL